MKIKNGDYFVGWVVIFFLLILSCKPPSHEDNVKLEVLRIKYGDRYSFDLDNFGLYMYVRLKPGARKIWGEDEEMYKIS